MSRVTLTTAPATNVRQWVLSVSSNCRKFV
jgi:hypothetical protein